MTDTKDQKRDSSGEKEVLNIAEPEVRAYNNYQEYVDHQKEKTNRVVAKAAKPNAAFQDGYDSVQDLPRRKQTFRERFEELNRALTEDLSGPSVFSPGRLFLCLGARLGSEVEALLDMGLSGHGIDLVPFAPYVLEGDFHNLNFQDNTIDVMYTNTIDHVYDLKGVFKEVTRVLTPGGHFIADIFPGNFSAYESIKIDSIEQVIACAPPNLKICYLVQNKVKLYVGKQSVQLIFEKMDLDD